MLRNGGAVRYCLVKQILCDAASALQCCVRRRHERHVSKTSRVSQMCESTIPLTWSTCHANMSVCAVMLLPGSSCHCATLEVMVAKRLGQIIRGYTMRPIHSFFMMMFREFPYETRAHFWTMVNLAPASFWALCPGVHAKGQGLSENQARAKRARRF